MRVFLPLHMDISQTARMALSGAHTSTKPNPLSYLLLLPAQHYRFIKICALFPEKLTKMWEKMPYLATLLKVRGISWDVAGSASKFIAGLFWAETHHPSRFCWNLFSSFCVILLTNRPTNIWQGHVCHCIPDMMWYIQFLPNTNLHKLLKTLYFRCHTTTTHRFTTFTI